MEASTYSIKDLEQLTGIKAHTLRIWEKRYQVVKPKRTATNIRYYSDADLKKLLNISILNRHGFKISNIASLKNEDLNQKILTISNKSFDSDSHVESLIVAMIEMDDLKFEKILTTLIINMGFEDTFANVLFPFFNKIGLLWQTGTITPAQEHFITNLIRQKMIVAIDGLTNTATHPNSKLFLLYLPDGELHEISLLYYSYLIQKKGHKVIYLGQMVPLEDVLMIGETRKPDVFLTVFTANLKKENIEEHLQKISLAFPDKKMFVSGLQFKLNDFDLPKNVELLEHASDLKDKLNEFK